MLILQAQAQNLTVSNKSGRHFEEKSCKIVSHEISKACTIFGRDISSNSELRKTLSECDISRFIESDFQLRSVYCLFDELVNTQLLLVFEIEC